MTDKIDKTTPENAVFDDIDRSDLPQSKEDKGSREGKKGKGVFFNTDKGLEIKKSKEQEEAIRVEKERVLEEQAIKNLKSAGILPPDF